MNRTFQLQSMSRVRFDVPYEASLYSRPWDEPGVYYYHLTVLQRRLLKKYFRKKLECLRKQVTKLMGKAREDAYKDVLDFKTWYKRYCSFGENAYWDVGNEVMQILEDDEEGDQTVHERMMYLRYRMTSIFPPPHPKDKKKTLAHYAYFAKANYNQ